jgi:toxin secretion/phage lysis holin
MLEQLKNIGQTILTAAAGSTSKETVTGGVTAAAGILGTMAGWLGGWDKSLAVLIVFIITDYITGVLGAIKTKTLNSDMMFWGGIRKITVIFVVGLSALVDGWIQPGTPTFRTAVIYFYAGREGLSIVENLGVIGVYLPPQVKDFLEQLNKEERTKKP